jgi:hypothetical protein
MNALTSLVVFEDMIDFIIVNFRKVCLYEILRTLELKPVSVDWQYHSSSMSNVSQ